MSLHRGPNLRAEYSRYGVQLATAALLLAWIPTLLHRSFDADEFEHSHAAWCVFRGMLPYRDFFEHHTPWYYYLLRPFFHGFDVAGSFESARHFLLCGRGLSLALTGLSVILVSRIGHLLGHRNAGPLAGLLLVSQPIFFEKSIEMRPDVLALPWLLGCLCFLLSALAGSPDSRTKRLRYFFSGGLCLGAAIMCTQKMLFVLPGVLAGLVLWSLLGGKTEESFSGPLQGTKAGAGFRTLLTLVFLLGISVPAGLTWTAFSFCHGGGAFITNNFLLNARWKHIETEQLRHLMLTSWPILALSLLGGARAVARFFRSGDRRYGEILLLCTLLGLFAGALVIPSAHGQYYLMPLPLVCWFAAQGLLFLMERVPARTSSGLFVLALVPLGVLPARALCDSSGVRNDAQLARLHYVFANTKPDDVVMDGWAGLGVFRPHAFHYFFLHRETTAMLPHSELAAYLDALEKGTIRPRLIAMDRNLATLGPRFQRFVRMNYMSNDGFFYFRQGFWRPNPGDLLREVQGFHGSR